MYKSNKQSDLLPSLTLHFKAELLKASVAMLPARCEW